MSEVSQLTPLYRRIPATSAPIAGQTIAFSLPVGQVTYASITCLYLKSSARATVAQIKADISRVRLKLNGILLWEVTGTAIMDTLAYMGLPQDNGDIPILFAQPTARTPVMEGLTSLGTMGLNSATLEFDIAAGAGASLDMYLIAQVHNRMEVPGWLIRRSSFTLTAAAAGDNEFKLETGLGSILGLHFNSANITGIQIKKDQAVILEGSLQTNHNVMKRYGRVPQTSYVHWEPVIRDNLMEAFPVNDADDFRVILTMSGAGSIALTYDTLWAPFGVPQPAKA